MPRKILAQLSLWLPPILWALMIYKLSTGSIPKASLSFWTDFTIKKFGHILLFGTLALLVYRGLIGEGMDRKKSAILAVVISILYGISDEYHQMFTQGREARIRDIFIDGIGAGLIIFVIYRFVSKLPKKIQLTLKQFGFV